MGTAPTGMSPGPGPWKTASVPPTAADRGMDRPLKAGNRGPGIGLVTGRDRGTVPVGTAAAEEEPAILNPVRTTPGPTRNPDFEGKSSHLSSRSLTRGWRASR